MILVPLRSSPSTNVIVDVPSLVLSYLTAYLPTSDKLYFSPSASAITSPSLRTVPSSATANVLPIFNVPSVPSILIAFSPSPKVMSSFNDTLSSLSVPSALTVKFSSPTKFKVSFGFTEIEFVPSEAVQPALATFDTSCN